MAVGQATLLIAADRDELFAFAVDEDNFFRLRPQALSHRVIEELPTGGHHCIQRWRVSGREIEIESHSLVFDPPSRIVDEARLPNGKRQIQERRFESVDGGAAVTGIISSRTRLGPLGTWFVTRTMRATVRSSLEKVAREYAARPDVTSA